MNYNNWKLWNNITFKTHGYRKNFDIINTNENIITEYDGTVSELNLTEQKPPRIIGEFGFSVWNLNIAKTLDIDVIELIKKHKNENTYDELLTAVNNKLIDISNVKKIVLIHSFVLHQDYRKHELTQELVESIYRDHYDDNVLVLALFMPFQCNPIDMDYYLKHKLIPQKNDVRYNTEPNILAHDYYSLDTFKFKNDIEFNTYKLFALANRCGFNRLDGLHLFVFDPNLTQLRIINKHNYGRSHTPNIETSF